MQYDLESDKIDFSLINQLVFQQPQVFCLSLSFFFLTLYFVDNYKKILFLKDCL